MGKLELIRKSLFHEFTFLIYLTFGPDIPSPCFIFNLTSCLPASLANMIGFDSFELLTPFPSGGVCRMLCVGDICAEINRLSEFCCHRKKRGKL